MFDKESHPGYPDNLRKKEVVEVVRPTEKDWDDYRKACEALEFLKQSPYFEDGGPEYVSAVSEPVDRTVYRFTETWDEYRERFNREESRVEVTAGQQVDQ